MAGSNRRSRWGSFHERRGLKPLIASGRGRSLAYANRNSVCSPLSPLLLANLQTSCCSRCRSLAGISANRTPNVLVSAQQTCAADRQIGGCPSLNPTDNARLLPTGTGRHPTIRQPSFDSSTSRPSPCEDWSPSLTYLTLASSATRCALRRSSSVARAVTLASTSPQLAPIVFEISMSIAGWHGVLRCQVLRILVSNLPPPTSISIPKKGYPTPTGRGRRHAGITARYVRLCTVRSVRRQESNAIVYENGNVETTHQASGSPSWRRAGTRQLLVCR